MKKDNKNINKTNDTNKTKNEKELKPLAKYEITTDTQIITGKERYFNLLLNGKEIGFNYDKKKVILINNETGKKSKPWQDPRGYKYFHVHSKGLKYNLPLHRVICALFIPIPPELAKLGYKQIHLVPNHIDGNKANTVESNLEWTTTQGNSLHAFENGLADVSKGENSHLAKITEKDAIKICELIMKKTPSKEIAEDIGCSLKTVIHIRSGECWKHISINYDFPKSDNRPYKYDDKLVHKICRYLEKNKYKDSEIAKKCGVNREYVRDIRLHKQRKEISCKYKF